LAGYWRGIGRSCARLTATRTISAEWPRHPQLVAFIYTESVQTAGTFSRASRTVERWTGRTYKQVAVA